MNPTLADEADQLLAHLQRAVYLLDEIRAGNTYSDSFLAAELHSMRVCIGRATGDAS